MDTEDRLIEKLYELNNLVVRVGSDVSNILRSVGVLLLLNLGANSGQIAAELLTGDKVVETGRMERYDRISPVPQSPRELPQ